MIFHCPECNARLRGTRPGAIIACGTCSNPVVVPAPSPERAAEDDLPLPPAPVERTRAQRSPWITAGIVLAVLAVAHVALYLLLTMGARSERKVIERDHSVSDLKHVTKPFASPQPGTPAYSEWRDQYDRWLAAGEYKRHGEHISLLRTWIAFSFIVQVAIVAWILLNYMRKRSRFAA